MQRFFPFQLTTTTYDPAKQQEVEETKDLVAHFNNEVYETLFTKHGVDPQRHDENRRRLGELNEKLQTGQLDEAGKQELENFDMVRLFESDAGDLSISTTLIYVATRTTNPELTREELAQALDASQTRTIFRDAVFPALLAFYGIDLSKVAEDAKTKLDEILAEAKAAAGEEGKD